MPDDHTSTHNANRHSAPPSRPRPERRGERFFAEALLTALPRAAKTGHLSEDDLTKLEIPLDTNASGQKVELTAVALHRSRATFFGAEQYLQRQKEAEAEIEHRAQRAREEKVKATAAMVAMATTVDDSIAGE